MRFLMALAGYEAWPHAESRLHFSSANAYYSHFRARQGGHPPTSHISKGRGVPTLC
jgi:hypothetical protein